METLESRLGAPQEVAEFAAAEHRRRFSARHPAVTFLLAPVPALLAIMSIYVAAIAGFGWMRGLFANSAGVAGAARLSATDRAIIELAFRAVGFVPFAFAAWVFARVARRADLTMRWPLAACGLLALVAMAFSSQLVLPTQPGNGSLSVGLGFPPSPIQLFQLVVPLAIGVWFAAGSRRNRSRFA